MQVKVVDGSAIIGAATLDRIDPPMGVASGRFLPTADYDPHRHANVIEGDFDISRGQSLEVHTDGQGRLDTRRIDIEDYTEFAGEKQLFVWFNDGGEFESYFSEHEDY